jgi:hypothetical protein
MYYSYVEIEYIATSFSPARTDLALKLFISPLQAGWKGTLRHITYAAMEEAIPPRALEGSSTPKEWEELVGWVL